MLNFRILENKAYTSLPCDYDEEAREGKVSCVDLLSSTINSIDTSNMNIVVVNKYYVARPDLISLAVYGEDKYADILCKLNGISNPFELNEDMIIYTPNLTEIDRLFNNTKTGPCELIDSTTTIARKPNPAQKNKQDVRTPSTPLKGDTNYIIDRRNGLVWY